jgi:TonB family protein
MAFLMVLVALGFPTGLSALGRTDQAQTDVSPQEMAGGDSLAKRKSNDELRDAAVTHPEPEYPTLAKAARISGRVEVEIAVDQEGHVTSARATSGHPLLKDSGTAAAIQWMFDPIKLSQTPTAIVGTLTFVFELAAEERRNKVPTEQRSDETTRANTLRAFREELGKHSPDTSKLAMSLANLAAAVRDENTVDEAISLFEEAERQKKLPADARPYYAELLWQKHNYNSEQSVDKPGFGPLAGQLVSSALQLFLQAYSDESNKEPIDGRKLADIGWRIAQLYVTLGRSDEEVLWLHSMSNCAGLSDEARAAINYYLGVHYWKKAYDLTSSYTTRHQALPDADVPRIRQWISEAYFYIEATHSLDPKHANAWFYEKLIALEEYKIEIDPEKKMALGKRSVQLQDRYIALVNEQRKAEDSSGSSYAMPYASGLPSLNWMVHTVAAPPAPPPPPPPPAYPETKPPR